MLSNYQRVCLCFPRPFFFTLSFQFASHLYGFIQCKLTIFVNRRIFGLKMFDVYEIKSMSSFRMIESGLSNQFTHDEFSLSLSDGIKMSF